MTSILLLVPFRLRNLNHFHLISPWSLANGEEVLQGGADVTMFGDFTPQHGVRGWSEMALTCGVAQITKKKGLDLSN